VLLAVICGTIAYSSDKDFRGWQRYASYTFLSALVVGLIGTFIPFFAIIVFLLTFAGFFMYLVYEIWATKVNYQYVLLNGVGLYSAFMGVFLHILQIILRVLASRRD
jgi:hypothetical protein